MSSKHDSNADRDQDLDETIERQISTSGLTGVMQTLTSDAAGEQASCAADEIDSEFAETVVIPSPDNGVHE